MRITDLRVHPCNAGWRNWVFLELITDEGLTGYGEATIEGREASMLGHLNDLRRAVIGADPLNINDMRLRLTRDPFWSGGCISGSGLGCVEMAMWDITGKHLGLPVWRLLGGKVHERVPVYANGWYLGARSTSDWQERARRVCALGYRAIKFDPFGLSDVCPSRKEVRDALDLVGAVREAVGPRIELFIEAHGRFSVSSALRIAAELAGFDCGFFEEPLPPGNAQALLHVTRSSPVPIAAGERYYSLRDAAPYLEVGAIHVLQCDVVHVGGISNLRELAALAHAWHTPIAPHNPNGPIATAASAHVAVTCPNLLMLEMLAPWDVPWREEVVTGAPEIEDGFLRLSNEPGLGVELHLDAVGAHPMSPIDLQFWSDKSVLQTVDLAPSA